jgi:CheY-like chemotaxis protein
MTAANPMPVLQEAEADRSCAKQAPQLLVIDDDVTHRMVICRLAQKFGYATTDASTIAEASELISTRHFDCMTLDLHMGAQSGTELLEVMNRRQSNVPVIVISSADDEERWEVLRVATLYGIRVTEVPKPLKIGRLRDVLLEIKDVT